MVAERSLQKSCYRMNVVLKEVWLTVPSLLSEDSCVSVFGEDFIFIVFNRFSRWRPQPDLRRSHAALQEVSQSHRPLRVPVKGWALFFFL